MIDKILNSRVGSSFDTILGCFEIEFLAHADGDGKYTSSLHIFEIQPRLPPGIPNLKIHKTTAIVFLCRSTIILPTIEVSAKLHTDSEEDWDTGEALDAKVWYDGNRVVNVGTESLDYLSDRRETPNLAKLCEHRDGKNELLTVFPRSIGMRELSLHYIVAENHDPDPEMPLTWFAVDQDHERIRAMLAAELGASF